jgi:creatinine amidohydrolase
VSRHRTEHRYEKLTWPDINDAVDDGQVVMVPCGAVEQHGPHLPLDVDLVCPCGIAAGAGREIPDKMKVLPVVAYGYTGHVMDFPGTINQHYQHFIDHVLDITKSLAYHGFKKIVLLNGHGSNMPNLDLVATWSPGERTSRPTPSASWRPGGICSRSTKASCPAGGRANSPAAAPTPASSKRRSTCISTATTFAKT